jgi:uncharacterized protein (TIGR00251 family)
LNGISAWEDGCRLEIKVQPRSSGNRLVDWAGGVLKVKLTAPPVEGEANRALVNFLAEVLEVSKRDIVILRGDTARLKLVGIHGLSPTAAGEKLKQHMDAAR